MGVRLHSTEEERKAFGIHHEETSITELPANALIEIFTLPDLIELCSYKAGKPGNHLEALSLKQISMRRKYSQAQLPFKEQENNDPDHYEIIELPDERRKWHIHVIDSPPDSDMENCFPTLKIALQVIENRGGIIDEQDIYKLGDYETS